jgi:hypothetical protein
MKIELRGIVIKRQGNVDTLYSKKDMVAFARISHKKNSPCESTMSMNEEAVKPGNTKALLRHFMEYVRWHKAELRKQGHAVPD